MKPIAFAVFMLTIRLYLVGNCTGEICDIGAAQKPINIRRCVTVSVYVVTVIGD